MWRGLTRAPLGSGESHILLGGGGSIQSTEPISKIQMPFDSTVRELSKHGEKFNLDVTDNVTGQVKVRMFDFSGLVTSMSIILMLNENKANESAWIVSLTFVHL